MLNAALRQAFHHATGWVDGGLKPTLFRRRGGGAVGWSPPYFDVVVVGGGLKPTLFRRRVVVGGGL